MPILCPSDSCMGCGACEQICPFDAIHMIPDSHGFLHPHIEPEKCKKCLRCENVCPVNHKPDNKNSEHPIVYAAWNIDDDIRKDSSSGGVFSVVANYVIGIGGVCWGAAYNEDMSVSYQCICSQNSLFRLRKSKYLQSRTDNAYIQIYSQLCDGKTVLFTGTPCHVNGLYSFLQQKNCSTENLITMDFICHGTPSYKVFRAYLNWIENKYNDKICDFNFRDKSYGTDNGLLTVGEFVKKGKVKFFKKENSYFTGMLKNLYIRECCHHCISNGIKRNADFTIADFWGLGKKSPFNNEKEKVNGISLIAVNSIKAKSVLNHLHDSLFLEQRPLDEAVEGNINYTKSSVKHPDGIKFWQEFERDTNWENLLHFFKPTLKEYILYLIKRYMGPEITNKLRRMK